MFKHYKKTFTTIKGSKFRLWVADSPEKKRIGLSKIKSLPRGWGMLFVYNTDVDNGFTMENTKIPLTIIFLDKDFNIIDSFKCKPYQKGSIKPDKNYRYVIEI